MTLNKALLRDAKAVKGLVNRIKQLPGSYQIMEVCGGQTHSIVRNGLDQLLEGHVTMLHGPGCPVCVTPMHIIDYAVQIAQLPNTIVCSYGDMMRVPGSHMDLLALKARGADIRILYSATEALTIAEQNPSKQVVFFGVGFETTAPMHAAALLLAEHKKIPNLSWLFSHYRVPPVLEALLSQPDCPVQGFLAAGHVCTVMGTSEYEPICQQYGVPITICGFEPVEILDATLALCSMINNHEAAVHNSYSAVVTRQGNEPSQRYISQVFEICDQPLRGIGVIPNAGLCLKSQFSSIDARHRFELKIVDTEPECGCIAGDVLKGRVKPTDCPLFGTQCNPSNPKGAPMVSGEGACAAYYRYRPSEVVS